MSPQQIQAISVLLGEAIRAGVGLSEILDSAGLTDEDWARIVEDVNRANARWGRA